MITLSIIKADTGGFVGHSAVHPDMMAEARREIERAKTSGLLIDGAVAGCGDDISLIMTHTYGCDAGLIHSFAWDTFQATTHIAKELGLYGAGQDLLSDAFSGNLRGMGPGYAELEFEERPSEPVKGRPVGPRDMFDDRPSTVPVPRPPRSWTTCGGTARSSRTGCRWRIWSTPPWPP